MTPHERALELIQLAARDERDARWLQTNPAIDGATIAFHYQQAAEKLLKALLAERNVDYPLTHDVERLLRLLEGAGFQVPVPETELVKLTPFTVTSRYEDDEESQLFDPVGTGALIQQLREWVEGKVQ
jgi:HEPN domain-containing protein